MARPKKSLLMGGAVMLTATGILAAAPMSAYASKTKETFSTYVACQVRVAQIVDGYTRAECKLETYGWPAKVRWRLYVYS